MLLGTSESRWRVAAPIAGANQPITAAMRASALRAHWWDPRERPDLPVRVPLFHNVVGNEGRPEYLGHHDTCRHPAIDPHPIDGAANFG